jgi:hypothetical protein
MVVEVSTVMVAVGTVSVAAGVDRVVITCVTGDCADCWLRQPEHRRRMMQATIMANRGIVFMISLFLEVIPGSIGFLIRGPPSGNLCRLIQGIPGGKTAGNIKTIRYIQEQD